MPPYCSCGVIQVSISPDNQIRLKQGHLHPVFSLIVLCDPCTNAAPMEDIRGHLGYKHGGNDAVSVEFYTVREISHEPCQLLAYLPFLYALLP